MPELSRNTIIQYRSRLRTLKMALEMGALGEADAKLAAMQIAELEQKLGPAVVPARPPGRPKKWVKITQADLDKLKAEGVRPETDWTQEARDKRAKEIIEQYKQQHASEEESAMALDDMIKLDKDAKERDALVQKANEELAARKPNDS